MCAGIFFKKLRIAEHNLPSCASTQESREHVLNTLPRKRGQSRGFATKLWNNLLYFLHVLQNCKTKSLMLLVFLIFAFAHYYNHNSSPLLELFKKWLYLRPRHLSNFISF